MSRAFDQVPAIYVPPGSNIGVVRKSYNDMRSFHPKKRIFESLAAAQDSVRDLPPELRVVAVYATKDAPTEKWERIRLI